MAGIESELLCHCHVRSQNLQYFGHILRIPHNSIEHGVMTDLWKEQGTVEEQSFAGMVWYTRVYRPTRHSIGHFGDGTKVLLD